MTGGSCVAVCCEATSAGFRFGFGTAERGQAPSMPHGDFVEASLAVTAVFDPSHGAKSATRRMALADFMRR
jgi:hypothetical protein